MKEKIIKDYMTYRKIECKNPDALKNYERYIRAFLDKANNTLSDLDQTYLTNHLNQISDNFSQKSLNNIKPLFKNFIKWKFLDYPSKFPLLDRLCRTKRGASSYEASQMLSEKEIKKLIEGEDDLFWKTFWLVFFYGGFRSIDVVRLKWDMFDFQKDGTTIIKAFIGKNQKTFYKCIPSEVTPIIQKWKSVNLSEWVFPSQRGDYPIHPKSPNQRLAKLSMKVLGKHINPYILRHSLASSLYPDGDENVVANQMGHSKSQKETYTHLNEEKLIKRAKKVWTTKEEMPKKEKDNLLMRIEAQDKDIKELKSIVKNHKTEISRTIKRTVIDLIKKSGVSVEKIEEMAETTEEENKLLEKKLAKKHPQKTTKNLQAL